MQDTTINPRILIQHYLYYPHQDLAYIPKLFAIGGDFEGKPAANTLKGKCQDDTGTLYTGEALTACITEQYKDENNAKTLKTFLTNKQVIWNTNNHEDAQEDKAPIDLRPKNFPSKETTYAQAREGDPKFLLMLKDKNPNNSENPNVGEIITTDILYRLFKDDPVRYFEKPQMRYMNRLFNSLDEDQDGKLEFNGNYTLKEIWLAIESDVTEIENPSTDQDSIQFGENTPDALKNQLDPDNFTIIPVPNAIGYEEHHDPSQIYFTNDISNAKFTNNAWEVQDTSSEKIKWAKKISKASEEEDAIYPVGSIMIYVPDGLIIRLVFDPTTKGNDYINDEVDFFDYDISDGFIYPTENAAQKAFNQGLNSLTLLVVEGNKIYEAQKEGSTYKTKADGSYIPNTTKDLTSSLLDSGNKLKDNLDNYYFPTDTQGESLLSEQTWFALTYEQGINKVRPKKNDQEVVPNYYNYAFGNANTRTGLGSLDWNFFNAQEELPKDSINWSDEQKADYINTFIAKLNKHNPYNAFFEKQGTGGGPTHPNLLGATYNLPAEKAEDSNPLRAGPNKDGSGENDNNFILNWEDNIDAPQLFDIYNTTNQAGMTVYSKKLQNTDYFPLYFKRTGGTYVLEKVLHRNQYGQDYDSPAETDLQELIELKDKNQQNPHSHIRTNQFWPMDVAPSYGTNGHDLKFGDSGKLEFRKAVGVNSIGQGHLATQDPNIAPGEANGSNFGSSTFEPSDDGEDHNSYFGMKFQIPFTLEEGYAAPLNYFFFGDDDMFVFLSKCTRANDEEGTIIDIDYESTVQIADLGGVHSSIGTYVNLWNFIPMENKVRINTRTGNGIREDIYYYKPTPTETATYSLEEEEIPTDIEKPRSQDYVLSFFYTERGASGSSCYMRFTVPFKGLTILPRSQDGELKISKEVRTAELAQSVEPTSQDLEKYVFELNLVNTDGSYFTNIYPIVIHNNDHGADLTNSIINTNSHTLNPVIQGDNGKNYQAIADGGRFTLTSGQHALIYGLPRNGPLGKNYTFTITEKGIYTGNPETENGKNLYEEENIQDLDKETTTTFRSGQFSSDPKNDLFENENWINGFQEGFSFSEQIGSQNAIEFVNSKAPAALSLEKLLEDQVPEDFSGTFAFQLTLKDENDIPFRSVPYFSSASNTNSSPPLNNQQNVGILNSPKEDGIFTLSLSSNEVVTLYGLPLKTKFEIMEIGLENGGKYTSSLQKIEVDGVDKEKTEIFGNTITGQLTQIPLSDQPENENQPLINASILAQYINVLEKVNQIRIRKLLIPASGLALEDSDTEYDFHFQITLTKNNLPLNLEKVYFKSSDSPSEGEIFLVNGKGQFQLKHNQEIKIIDIPEGTSWNIQELNGNVPIDLDGKIDDKYFLAWQENNTGDLDSQTAMSTALFVNIKPNPNDNGGLKILTGNRPDSLKEGEFKFLLKGRSFSPREEISSLDHSLPMEESQENLDTSISNSIEENDQELDDQNPLVDSISDDQSLNNLDNSLNDFNSINATDSLDSLTTEQNQFLSEEYLENGFLKVSSRLANLLGNGTYRKILPSSYPLGPLRYEDFEAEELVDQIPMPEGTNEEGLYTISGLDILANTGTFSFPTIDFKQAGTYVYELWEEIPTQKDPMITYDSNKYWVQVIVDSKAEDPNQFEIKSINYFTDPELTESAPNNIARFINYYLPPVTPTPPSNPGGSTPKPPSISLIKEQRKISPDGTTSAWNKQDRNNPMQVNPGDIIEYQITASNTSSTSAQNVVITDSIPIPEGTDAQLVLDRDSLQGQDVTINGNQLTWKIGTLTRKGTSGASKSVTFKVMVPQVSGNTLWENIAHATFGPNPNKPTGDTPSNKVDSEANPNAKIQLIKEQRKISGLTPSEWNKQDRDNPMIVAGGDIVEYRLTVKVTGTQPLANVTIRDPIPSYEGSPGNLTLVSSSLSGNVNFAENTLTWYLGTMQPGESQSITFQVIVPLTQGQTLWANIATVTHGEDPNNPEETIPSNTVVIEENPSNAKIKLLKEQRKISNGVASEWNIQDRSNPMIVNGRDIVEYRLTTTVVGQVPLLNVTIRDPIPTYEGSPGDLVLLPESLSGEVNVENGVLIWHLGTMQPGESRSVTFQVRVPTTVGQTMWSNVASVSHGEDPDDPEETVPSNVVTIVENPGSTQPALSLLKEQRLIRNGVASAWNTQGRDNPMTVQAGDVVEYRLSVTNKTTTSIPNVVIRDTLPTPSGSTAQLSLVSQNTSKGTTSRNGQTLVWTIGTLAPQEVVAVSFQVLVPNVTATTLWPNIGTVTYGEDPNNPDGTIPSNEVDIRETPKNTTTTTTPPSTNTTRPPTTTPPHTNSQTSKVTPNKGSDASTGTNTYSNVWLGIMMLSLFALGVGFYGWKKKES